MSGTHLIVGGDSNIGQALGMRLAERGCVVAASTRRSPDAPWFLDLAAEPASCRLPDRVETAYLCAAATSLNRCRQDPAGTRLINVERTLELAKRLRQRGAHLVFCSTSQVYDGAQPLRLADEATCSLSEYGKQKAAVERNLLDEGGATIVRFTKIVPPTLEMVCNWAKALRGGESISPFSDLVFSPVPLAIAVEVLISAGSRREGGIVQVSGERDVSYAELAMRLALRLSVPAERVKPVSFSTKGLPPEFAPRHTTLDSARLESEWGIKTPPVADMLDAIIERAIHD